ncbi:MAG TPA: hypothetical protein VF624_04125 [Tepidisphaeraceae bacterium]|jgi:hypothetical protein
MRKGFDASLARALQTTPDMLFNDWRGVPPEHTDRVLFHPDQFFAASRDELLLLTPVDELLIEVSRRLWQGEVEDVLEYAVKLVLARNDERAPEFREIAERFKMFEQRKPPPKEDVRKAIPRGEMWLHPGGPPGPLQPTGRTKKKKTQPRTINRASQTQRPVQQAKNKHE